MEEEEEGGREEGRWKACERRGRESAVRAAVATRTRREEEEEEGEEEAGRGLLLLLVLCADGGEVGICVRVCVSWGGRGECLVQGSRPND